MGFSWSKLLSLRQSRPNTRRADLAQEINVPLRTLNHRLAQQDKRLTDETSHFLESEAGELFVKRLVVGTIYTFCIKGGVGASRVEEFFERIKIYSHVGISERSILRILQQIEQAILAYKDLQESDLVASQAYGKELQVTLGLDETWLDEMLLVCQDLISRYLFLKSRP
jgi:hypothetical protein